MRKTWIIIASIIGVIILVGLGYWFLYQPTYCDKNYGFCFKYPRGWKIILHDEPKNKELLFYNKNELAFKLMNPYWEPAEKGVLIEDKIIKSNNLQTKLFYSYYDAILPGMPKEVFLQWQKNCLKLPCDYKLQSGGTIVVDLSLDNKKQAEQLQMLNKIIKTFKIL